MSKNDNPFRIRKILYWVLSALMFVIGIILLIPVFLVNSESNFLLHNSCLVFASLLILGSIIFVALGWMWAYEFELKTRKKQRDLYLKKDTRYIEEEYLALDADIRHRSRKKAARSIRAGFKREHCPRCGDEIESDEAYCGKCGTKLERLCPKCKTVNTLSDKFCRNCGNKL